MYNYQKKPYKAQAVQWSGTNTEEVVRMLKVESRLHDKYLMLKHNNGDFSTLEVGHWVVRGENGEVKTYDNAIFCTKYTEIIEWEARARRAEYCLGKAREQYDALKNKRVVNQREPWEGAVDTASGAFTQWEIDNASKW